MKKLLRCSILLTLLLILIFSTSCTETKNIIESQKLKYYTPYQETDITDIIERYNKYCKNNLDESYQIEIVKFNSSEEMYTKMSTEFMSGEGPDIISLDEPFPFEKLVDNGVFADFDELVNTYNSNINFDDYNGKIMEAGIINGKRYFVPFFYCPNVLISTQETLDKYGSNSSGFSYKELSQQISNEKVIYSLFGNKSDNDRFLYSFLDNYADFDEKTTYFDTDDFFENLDYIVELVKNDNTNKDIYYSLDDSENESCLFLTPKSFLGGSISGMKSNYYYLCLLNKKPVILPNYSKENKITAYVECGVFINQNSDKKEKALAFIEYCLSEDVQEYWCGSKTETTFSGTNIISLPVNNSAFDYAVEVETNTEWDHNEDGEFDEAEREFSEKVDSMFWKDYLSVIDDISECSLYDYKNLENNYYNSSVIGNIVNKYLSGDISKSKFINQLSSATEIYFKE